MTPGLSYVEGGRGRNKECEDSRRDEKKKKNTLSTMAIHLLLTLHPFWNPGVDINSYQVHATKIASSSIITAMNESDRATP